MTAIEDRGTVRLRRVARIWSVVVIVFALVMGIGHIVSPEEVVEDYPPAENLLPLMMALSVLGLGLAFRWELLGGAMNVGFWLLNVLLYWIIKERFFPLGGLAALSPALVPGLLFLVCWWRSRSRGSA